MVTLWTLDVAATLLRSVNSGNATALSRMKRVTWSNRPRRVASSVALVAWTSHWSTCGSASLDPATIDPMVMPSIGRTSGPVWWSRRHG